ncbi:MAG: 3-isopropylmalate dehydratase small subunit [Desulfurococcales archaeon]|nr:3-isopropylmalate dehydratase small subunit [Desulfurococcales archaeon]
MITVIEGKVAPLPIENIDTDQIIPAQFLKITKREGLGKYLFYRWRYDEQGRPKDGFILDDPKYSGASILVTGRNFGIGSSREHAVWALIDYGIKAIIAPSFGDIFYENAARNGLVCVKVREEIAKEIIEEALKREVYARIDLENKTLSYLGKNIGFEIEESVRKRLMLGLDDVGLTLELYEGAIKRYEEKMKSYIKIRKGIFTPL